ncbi:Homeodomain-interacting protein kinase 1, partial [Nibea albiflora]
VAVKVDKNCLRFVWQARLEIGILKRLRCLDPDACNIVKLNESFFDKTKVCMRFELMNQRQSDNQGLSTRELRPIMHKLATTLDHLSSTGLVHTDLKPDRMMFVNRHERPLKVKLIDFGLAQAVADIKPSACVQATYYREPEVHIPIHTF